MRHVWVVGLLMASLVAVDGNAKPSKHARALVADANMRHKARGGLVATLAPRPSLDGTGRILPAHSHVPLVISFVTTPTATDRAMLAKLGASVHPRVIRDQLIARVPVAGLAALAANPRVTRMLYDGIPFGTPRPLDVTSSEIQADDVWRTVAPDGVPLTGEGVTVCDSDSGVDVFHPSFFRADGGYFAWHDANGNGRLEPAIDGVDWWNDGVPVVLQVLNGVVSTSFDDTPLFGSNDPNLRVGMDWLYADLNLSGVREHGRPAGFSDVDPGMGEPLFVVDDVNENGIVDAGEKLVLLGSSKLAAVRVDGKVYRRGEDLVDAPRDEDIGHGTSSTGVIIGGQRGLSTKVGISPGADFIMANRYDDSALISHVAFCIDEGARVVLHEYAPWYGYHLDGSDPLEQLIDDSSLDEGVAHINPAGNLSTSQKGYKRLLPAGQTTSIEIVAPPDSPYGKFRFFASTLLWRDVDRDLGVVIEDPTGYSVPLPDTGFIYEEFHDDLFIYAERFDSNRGTARFDVYIFDPDYVLDIDHGNWWLHVTDPGTAGDGDIEVVAHVADDVSGWGQGIYFPDFVSEDHFIGYPGTADYGIAVAAYTGNGHVFGNPGERAFYSGRGFRIDGVDILSISAPDDPIAAGYHDGSEASYSIYGGTSGASPHVAGAAALLIQSDPSLDGEQVRSRIRDGAYVDQHVGTAPNHDWGYGKLRIHQSIYGAPPAAGTAPNIEPIDLEVYVGEPTRVEVVVSDPDGGPLVVQLDRDYDGTYDESFDGVTFEVSYLERGVYWSKLQVVDSTGRSEDALARFSVVDRPSEPTQPSRPIADGRDILTGRSGMFCLCEAPGAPRQPDGSGWLALFGLGLAIGVRGRARPPSRVTDVPMA